MQPLYRTNFRIRHKDKNSTDDLFDAVAATCLRWVTEHPSVPNGNSAISLAATTLEPLDLGRGWGLRALRVTADQSDAWALRLRHPDRDNAGLSWTTELGLLRASDSAPAHFSCSVLLGREDNALVPLRRSVSRPRVVPEILSRFHCAGAFSLLNTPVRLENTDGSVRFFVELLENPVRTHPIVFVSAAETSPAYATDYHHLAGQLGGLAHVVVASNAYVSELLSFHLSDFINCFEGAVRIYWPGFRRTDRPFQHPLFVLDHLRSLDASQPRASEQLLLEQIASVAIANVSGGFLTWGHMLGRQRAALLAEAKAAGNQDEWISALEEDNRAMAETNAQLQHARAEQEAVLQQLRGQIENYRFALEERKAGRVALAQETQLPVRDVAEAISRAQERHPDRLAFAFNSKSDEKACPFEEAGDVSAVFDWLATRYYLARMGQAPEPDFDRSLRETVEGWNYAPQQSKLTMNNAKLRDWYHCTWEERTYALPEHIRCGSGHDARYCLRIGFDWDPERHRVVIGYLGQHQKNLSS